MPIKHTKKPALRNPALIAAAGGVATAYLTNKGNKKSSETSVNSNDAKSEIIKQSASVIPFVIKLGIFLGVGYIAYKTFVKSFNKIGEINNLPPANISDGEAQTRANSIYAAMYGFGANYRGVSENLAGLNYNGWVRLYNAFGHRAGANPLSEKKDLVWWINDQFSENELQQLRFILPNVF